jgi:hypothetical protein
MSARAAAAASAAAHSCLAASTSDSLASSCFGTSALLLLQLVVVVVLCWTRLLTSNSKWCSGMLLGLLLVRSPAAHDVTVCMAQPMPWHKSEKVGG